MSFAVLLVGSASTTAAGRGAGEPVFVKKVIGDSAIIVRSNSAVYLIEKGIGCQSLWRHQGKAAMIDSPSMFLAAGSWLIIPDANQRCRIWQSREIESSRSFPRAPSRVPVDEFAFFDSHGRTVVYVEPGEGLTFYLWSGEPVAYLEGDSVYSFSEKHLGWYKDGLVYDHDGNVVVAPASPFRTAIGVTLARGLTGLKPLMSFTELQPIKPEFGTSWSQLSARAFFAVGVD